MSENNLAIKVDNISKIYRLGAKDIADDSLGKAMFNFVKSPVENYKKYKSLYSFNDVDMKDKEERLSNNVLWALRDLSFNVEQGEVVGIIGTNGAGKSTLLKILARITPPTKGRLHIRGRISSLLEVGTGFHPELTGRENIFLNGTILGMKKKEVAAKFDEIVDFSGVEQFLDTPVKRYSSGMRVRLAFAVAAHLEPEILIIDEVLAVGDAEFQKKCLNKMQDVGQHGRTVLFVSHNMQAVTRLCTRAILLNQGSLLKDGTPEEIVAAYLNEGHGMTTHRTWEDLEAAPGDEYVKLRSMRVKNKEGQTSDGAIDIRTTIGIEMQFQVLKEGKKLMPYYDVLNEDGVTIFSIIDLDPTWSNKTREVGTYTSTVWIPSNLLNEGTLYVRATIRTEERKYRPISERDAVAFNVVDKMEGSTARGEWVGRMSGSVRPMLEWETDFVKG